MLKVSSSKKEDILKNLIFNFKDPKIKKIKNPKNTLGGKGANLAEMGRLGMPVPPGFIISTDVCDLFYKNKKKLPKQILKSMQTKLIFSQEDSHANHSHLQEKEKVQMMNATCGTKCFEQYKKLNPNSSLLKMSMVSQILMADWYSSRCALTWKLKGTKFNRLLFLLVPKTHRTEEIDAGLLLPTPNARDWKDTIGNGKDAPSIGVTRGYSLGQKINSLLPTPTAMDCTNATATMKSTQVKQGSMHSVTLVRAISMGILPTPTAGSKHSQHSMGEWGGSKNNMRHIPGIYSPLNPRFVAEMMGFPPNWTELPFQNGEQNPSKDTVTQ